MVAFLVCTEKTPDYSSICRRCYVYIHSRYIDASAARTSASKRSGENAGTCTRAPGGVSLAAGTLIPQHDAEPHAAIPGRDPAW